MDTSIDPQVITSAFVTGEDLSPYLTPLSNESFYKLFWQRVRQLDGLLHRGSAVRKLNFADAIGPVKLSEMPQVADAIQNRAKSIVYSEQEFLAGYEHDHFRGLHLGRLETEGQLIHYLVLGVSRHKMVVLLVSFDESNPRGGSPPTWKLLSYSDSLEILTMSDRGMLYCLAYQGFSSIGLKVEEYVKVLRERFEGWERINTQFETEQYRIQRIMR